LESGNRNPLVRETRVGGSHMFDWWGWGLLLGQRPQWHLRRRGLTIELEVFLGYAYYVTARNQFLLIGRGCRRREIYRLLITF
jgi:hypothetical protein